MALNPMFPGTNRADRDCRTFATVKLTFCLLEHMNITFKMSSGKPCLILNKNICKFFFSKYTVLYYPLRGQGRNNYTNPETDLLIMMYTNETHRH